MESRKEKEKCLLDYYQAKIERKEGHGAKSMKQETY
jgi:serine/threonine protein kinase